MTRAGLAVMVGLGAVLLGAPAPAQAACAAPAPGYSPGAESDIVVEGVLLSGPSRDALLFSPAWFAVSRYLKGSGPRVLPVTTKGRQIAGVFAPGLDFWVEDTFYVRAGQTWRLYFDRGETPFLGSGCDFANRPVRRSRVLRPHDGTSLRARGGWRAQRLDGPGRVRCVRIGIQRRARIACARTGPALAIAHRLDRRRPETGIAVAGSGLRRVVIRARDGRPLTARAGRGGAVLGVLPRILKPGDVSIVATFASGATRELGALHRRAVSPDGSWAADSERPHGRRRRPARCVTVDDLDAPGLTDRSDGSRAGYCGPNSLFFAVRKAGKAETLVFGGVTSDVASVTLESGGQTWSASIARRGGAFIAVIPRAVGARAVTVRIRLHSGVERVFVGRRSLNLSRPPR